MVIFETTKDFGQKIRKLKIMWKGFYIIKYIVYLCRLKNESI